MQQLIKFTPEDAHKIVQGKRNKYAEQFTVDYTMFYADLCKVHPVDVLLSKIKEGVEQGKTSIVFGRNHIWDNLKYEEKFTECEAYYKDGNWIQRLFKKPTKHTWLEKDWDNLRHYNIIEKNIMRELEIYLCKTGWCFETHHDTGTESDIVTFTIYP